MKKIVSIFIAIIFIIILAGCSSEEFDSAMESGKEAIEASKYEEAQSFFEQALEIKPDEDEPKNYLEQTKNILQAFEFLNDAKFNEAKKAFNAILTFENGSATLQSEAESNLAEIKELEATYHEADTSFEEAKKLEQKGEFSNAISLIDQTLENDLAHPAFDSLKQELEAFKVKTETTKEDYIRIKTAYDKSETLNKNKAYDEAVSLIDETLQNEFSHTAFKSLEEDLNTLKTNVLSAKKNNEAQGKKQELIDQVMGYWSHVNNDYELCEFNKTEFVCAVVASDFYYYERISSWDVDLDNATILINETGKLSLPSPNTLAFGEEKYNRISEKQVTDLLTEFGIDDKPEFFDINRYEEWDS